MSKKTGFEVLVQWKMSQQRDDPTNNALLVSFLLSSDAEILLLSTDGASKIGAKRANTRVQRVRVLTELPFCMSPLLVGEDKRRTASG